MTKRKISDILMTSALVFLSASHLTGNGTENLLHEICGTVFLLALAVHLARNRKWFPGIFRGTYRAGRTLTLVTDLALLALAVLTAVSSLTVSRTVFSFLNLPGAFPARRLHLAATAWLIPLCAFHLGLHRGRARIGPVWIVLSVCGAAGFVLERYWERLLLLRDFAYVPALPEILLYGFGLTMMLLFELLGALAGKAARKADGEPGK